mgnify:CR=1 FL=1
MKRREFLKTASIAAMVAVLTGCKAASESASVSEAASVSETASMPETMSDSATIEALIEENNALRDEIYDLREQLAAQESEQDRDTYTVDVSEMGASVYVTCKKGGTTIDQSITVSTRDKMNEVVASMLEAFGQDTSDVENHNWQSIDTHVDLSNQIIYGEMAGSYNDVIILHVPEGTTGNFTVAFREDNGNSKELKGADFELTTDNLTAVLGSRCISVRTE